MIECSQCHGQIARVDAPTLPVGFSAGSWEGWFHIDKEREHFVPVGWYDLEVRGADFVQELN